MKKIIFTVLLLLSFIFINTVSAHPGRTDKYGGHVCKTNCAKRGFIMAEKLIQKKIRIKKKAQNSYNLN